MLLSYWQWLGCFCVYFPISCTNGFICHVTRHACLVLSILFSGCITPHSALWVNNMSWCLPCPLVADESVHQLLVCFHHLTLWSMLVMKVLHVSSLITFLALGAIYLGLRLFIQGMGRRLSCSCRRLTFDFQHPHGSSQGSIPQFQGLCCPLLTSKCTRDI